MLDQFIQWNRLKSTETGSATVSSVKGKLLLVQLQSEHSQGRMAAPTMPLWSRHHNFVTSDVEIIHPFSLAVEGWTTGHMPQIMENTLFYNFASGVACIRAVLVPINSEVCHSANQAIGNPCKFSPALQNQQAWHYAHNKPMSDVLGYVVRLAIHCLRSEIENCWSQRYTSTH